MPYPKTKRMIKTERIRELVKLGYSSTKIQKTLSSEKLGVRRKVLLTEIRNIKQQKEPTQTKRLRSIPKKFRGAGFGVSPVPTKEDNQIYRYAVIINDVPVHSKPLKRNYLGFRLLGYYKDKKKLNSAIPRLKDLCLANASQYLGYNILDWSGFELYYGKEYPVQIITHNANMLDGRWTFKVEKEGREIGSEKSGFI